jgi:hypothetical protein
MLHRLPNGGRQPAGPAGAVARPVARPRLGLARGRSADPGPAPVVGRAPCWTWKKWRFFSSRPQRHDTSKFPSRSARLPNRRDLLRVRLGAASHRLGCTTAAYAGSSPTAGPSRRHAGPSRSWTYAALSDGCLRRIAWLGWPIGTDTLAQPAHPTERLHCPRGFSQAALPLPRHPTPLGLNRRAGARHRHPEALCAQDVFNRELW